MLIIGLFFIFLLLFYFWCLWLIFEKMGRPGWNSIIPIYNMMVLAEKADKPNWWGILTAIPYIGVIWGIWIWNIILKKFGKPSWWIYFFIFLGFIAVPMLAFNKETVFEDNDPTAGLLEPEEK